MRKLFLFIVASAALVFGKAQVITLDSFEIKLSRELNPQLIDTRSAEEFSINHLPGAINISTNTAGYQRKISKLDKSAPVFLYAIGTTRSKQLGDIFRTHGFREIYILDGGIGGWIGNGKKFYSGSTDSLSQIEFNNILLSNPIVVVDLHTKYCPVCRKLQPVVDTLAREFGDGIKVIRIDVCNNPHIASTFKIDAIPTLIAFYNGKDVYRATGPDIDKKEIEGILSNAVISH